MRCLCLCLTVLIPGMLPAVGQPWPALSYVDSAAAQRDWQPQFGSKPARIEKLDDGGACLALDAEFAAAGSRACWDWVGRLDLSQTGRVALDLSATGGDLAQTVMVFFGTPGGWYATHLTGNIPAAWTRHARRLDTFGTEGKPDGWGQVTRFRFSVWSSGPGKATFRLRGLRLLPADPDESLLVNGSFEIPGPGIPYAWGSGHWGVGHMPWAADMDTWRRRWHLDSTVARDGKWSLCLENQAGSPLLSASSVWFSPPRSVARGTLSAWLKSSREKLPVKLTCGSAGTQVAVGPEWMQAVLPNVVRQDRLTAAIVPQAAGTLWIDAVQFQVGDHATPEYHPPFSDDALATREAAVDWSPPGRTAEVAAGRGAAPPVTPARVTIDAHGRFLLDGHPYIQHSLGLEFIDDLDILDFVARSGFHDVCYQIRATITTARLKQVFDRCARVGLRIIPWLDGGMTRERFTEHITTLRDHPALLCWYVYDEPSGERFAEADARVQLARQLDPSHPALINYLSDKLAGHTGDIYSTDVYPIPHGSPGAAVSAVARMQAAAEQEHKPVWMWLQGTGYAYWMAREPSPRELSCMAYGSLLMGARGIYYFAQVPRTKECFSEMRALCVELEALTPVLCSLEATAQATCDQPAILARTYAHAGARWFVTVNTQGTAREVGFRLPGTGPVAEVVFEGRTVAVTAGAWRDRFGPYERHVYRLPDQG